MLDDLAPLLKDEKGADFVGRLESKLCEQAIPAEMELAVLWALSQLGEVEIEPDWFGDRLPEAYTEALIAGQPTVVEVLAVSDGAMSGEAAMRSTTQRLVDLANSLKSGSGAQLYFRFQEQNGYEGRQYFRRRMAPSKLQVSPELRNAFEAWLKSPHADGDHTRLRDTGLDVVVEWKAHRPHRLFNFFSHTPPECYSLTENPLYPKLKEKSSQLASQNFSGLRCLFLVDAGSTLLRQLKEVDSLRRKFSGADIIRYFMQNNEGIDVICVVSVQQNRYGRMEPPRWEINLACLPGRQLDLSNFDKLAQILPPPQRSGYQARSLHQQGMFKPTARGWYRGMQWGGSKMKISSRSIQDLLAGKIDMKLFEHMNGFQDGRNLFKLKLDRGEVIKSASIEHGGPDKDDDFLVLEFEPDASAMPFQFRKPIAKVENS